MEAKQVTMLLEHLGLNRRYRGYPYLISCICLVKKNQELLFSTSEVLYTMVAKKYRVTPGIVSNDIRTVISSYWERNNAARFYSVIGYPVKDKIAPKEFIAVIVSYLSNVQP